MLLKPMRFKDYTWPHNPEIYAVEYRRQIAAHKIPLGGWYLQDLGRTYRIFRGEGIFAGERAYEEFQTLAEVFDQTGPGLLVHPVWRTVSAYFVTLELMEEPLPDYVRYRFSFWEDSTASGIAWRYGVALTALIAANPQIKNPNLIYPGDQVRIP